MLCSKQGGGLIIVVMGEVIELYILQDHIFYPILISIKLIERRKYISIQQSKNKSEQISINIKICVFGYVHRAFVRFIIQTKQCISYIYIYIYIHILVYIN